MKSRKDKISFYTEHSWFLCSLISNGFKFLINWWLIHFFYFCLLNSISMYLSFLGTLPDYSTQTKRQSLSSVSLVLMFEFIMSQGCHTLVQSANNTELRAGYCGHCCGVWRHMGTNPQPLPVSCSAQLCPTFIPAGDHELGEFQIAAGESACANVALIVSWAFQVAWLCKNLSSLQWAGLESWNLCVIREMSCWYLLAVGWSAVIRWGGQQASIYKLLLKFVCKGLKFRNKTRLGVDREKPWS